MDHCKTATLEKRFARRGLKVNRGENRICWVEVNGHVIDWIDEGGTAVCLKVRNANDHDDLQSDYFAGSFAHSIKQAFQWAGIV